MADPKDSLDRPDVAANEVAIAAAMEGNSVTIKARSRLVSALDRLLGTAIDILGVQTESRAEKARIIAEAELELMRVDARAVIERVKADPEGAPRRVSAWLKGAQISAENRAEIASHAIEELEQIEYHPENASSLDEEIAAPFHNDFEDWLNAFAERADGASSEQMRVLFGKILAGEVFRPGSFSIATLRIVSELDQRIASIFQEVCREALSDRSIPKRSIMRGQYLIDMYDLEERGLIKEAGGDTTNMEIEAEKDGFYYVDDNDYRLRIKGSGNLMFSVMMLTISGKQISGLLAHDEIFALKAAAEKIKGQIVAIDLIKKNPATGVFTVIETLKASEKPAEEPILRVVGVDPSTDEG